MNKTLSIYCSLFILSLFISACSSTRPIIKIGLVAPFVGHYREIGEEVIYAVRLAVREANESGGVAGYSIELMAFDDEGDSILAEENARKLSTDPQVVGVIGHWLDSTSLAAAPVYADSGIAYLATTASPELDPAAYRLWYTEQTYLATAPDSMHCPLLCDPLTEQSWLQSQILNPQSKVLGSATFGLNLFPRLYPNSENYIQFLAPAPQPADSTDPTFADRYLAISHGPQPRYLAVLVYDATQLLLKAIQADINANELPTRSGVTTALAQVNYDGLSGSFSFDSERDWSEADGWVYQWSENKLVRP